MLRLGFVNFEFVKSTAGIKNGFLNILVLVSSNCCTYKMAFKIRKTFLKVCAESALPRTALD